MHGFAHAALSKTESKFEGDFRRDKLCRYLTKERRMPKHHAEKIVRDSKPGKVPTWRFMRGDIDLFFQDEAAFPDFWHEFSKSFSNVPIDRTSSNAAAITLTLSSANEIASGMHL
jgi:hypothetical protein